MQTLRTKIAVLTLATSAALGAGVVVAHSVDAQTDDTEQIDRSEQREERLQALVDDGVITQERADEIRARMADRAAHRLERQTNRTDRLDELAATLGTTADDLKADLRAGASIADLADAAGVDLDMIIADIEAAQTERINQAVADGKIDQDRADEIADALTDRITARLNGERPEGLRGDGPRGFGPRHNRPGR